MKSNKKQTAKNLTLLSYSANSLLFIIFLISTLLVSCKQEVIAPAPSPSNNTLTPVVTPSQRTTIVWSFWGDPWEIEINKRLIKVFKADHPEINVEPLSTSWTDYFQKADEWLNSTSPPDVMFFDYIPDYASRGLLEDLGPYIKSDNYDLADFYEGLLKYNSYNGKQYGIPRDNDTKVIFYNKTLFDEAGIPYPKSGWTLEDLRQTALKLTKKNGDNITQYGFAYEPDEWWRLWVWLKGGELYDNDFSPTRLLLDSPEAVGALQWLSDLTNVDRVTPPYEIQQTSLNIGQLFQDEKLAMCFGNHALIPAFAAKSSLRWDVVGMPAGKTRLNAAGGSGYVIPANSKNKEAAWTFLKWLESSKGQAIFTETGVIVPARRSVGHADIFLKQDPPHNASVFLEETERGRPNPMFKGIQEIQSALNESLVPLWQGKVSAETAVRDLVPRVNLALNKN